MNKKTFLAISILLSISSQANSQGKMVAVIKNDFSNSNFITDPLPLPEIEVEFKKTFNGVYRFALDTEGNIWEGNNNNEWAKTDMSGFSDLSVSETHGYALKNGVVYAIGDNLDGQLGLGDLDFKSSWVETSFSGVSSIEAVGGDDGCISQGNGFAIKNGTVYSIGANTYGQLGRNSSDSCDFRDCARTWGSTGLSNIKKIEGGVSSVFAISNDNKLYGTGSSDYHFIASKEFVEMLSGVQDISVDSQHAYAIKSGTVYSQGSNLSGQLGLGNTTETDSFISTGLTGVSKVAAFGDGEHDSSYGVAGGLAIKDNELYVVGTNREGQLGLGESNRDIVHSWRASGELNVTDLHKGLTPYIVKDDKLNYSNNGVWKEVVFLVDSDGDGVYDHIEKEDGTDPNDPNDFNMIVKHPESGHLSYSLTKDISYLDNGGEDDYGNDISSMVTFSAPEDNLLEVTLEQYKTESGYDYFYIYDGVNDSGNLLKTCDGGKCAGSTFLSTTGSLTFKFESDSSSTELGWNAKIKLIKIQYTDYDKDGIYDYLDPDDDNDGFSDEVESRADTNPLDENDYPSLAKFKDIDTFSESGYALDINNTLWVVGANKYGQLGVNSTENYNYWVKTSMTNVVDFSAGETHAYVVDSNGKLWATGAHNYGQLGLGDRGCGSEGGGCKAIEWTQVQNTQDIDSAFIVKVEAGQRHGYALDNNGKIWSTGSNSDGELGLGGGDDQNVWTITPNTEDIYYASIVDIFSGLEHAYAIDTLNRLWVVGDNGSRQQLGIGVVGDQESWTLIPNGLNLSNVNIIHASAADDNGYAIDSTNKLWVVGDNNDGKLGLGDEIDRTSWTSTSHNNVLKVESGDDTALFLDNTNGLYGAGDNYYGQLGLGDSDDKTIWTKIDSAKFGQIKDIAVGEGHSYLIDENGYIWSTGKNSEGQLGLDSDRGCGSEGGGCKSLEWVNSIVFD